MSLVHGSMVQTLSNAARDNVVGAMPHDVVVLVSIILVVDDEVQRLT